MKQIEGREIKQTALLHDEEWRPPKTTRECFVDKIFVLCPI